jgi:pilus assembly protein CpaB
VTRRRRGALLLALALVLGILAGSDVARRESALREQLGPLVPVVIARRPLAAGHRLQAGDLAVKEIPARYVLAAGGTPPELLVNRRLNVPVPDGGAIALEAVATTAAATQPLRRGERAAAVVAAGDARALVPGARVDVLVTRDGGDGTPGGSELALQDVEVLAAHPVPAASARDDPRVAATLRVGLRQAVYLAAAGTFAREIRLLARAPGDRARAPRTTVGEDLP